MFVSDSLQNLRDKYSHSVTKMGITSSFSSHVHLVFKFYRATAMVRRCFVVPAQAQDAQNLVCPVVYGARKPPSRKVVRILTYEWYSIGEICLG